MEQSPAAYRDELTASLGGLAVVLKSAQEHSLKWQAWQRLQFIDETGLASIVPYTPASLGILENAYAMDENDGGLIHHLAIAYHAMAWDIELDQPENAVESWEKALFYWRKLQTCEIFWKNLYAKGKLLGLEFDQPAIEDVRHNLIIYLLEIHIEFIRHLIGSKRYDQASRHIEIIRRSRIPVAIRKELAGLVYESMIMHVPNLVAEGNFSDALCTLDSFLNLFPSHQTALQNYLENSRQWIKQLSPLTDWQEILNLIQRLSPKWEKLHNLNSLSNDLAMANALGDTAESIGNLYLIKLEELQLQSQEDEQNSIELNSEDYNYCLQAIAWLSKALSKVQNYAIEFRLLKALSWKAGHLAQCGLKLTEFDESQQIFGQAFSACEEAIELNADQLELRKQAAWILGLKVQHGLSHLPPKLDISDYSTYISYAKGDLTKAIQFDPDNLWLQELLITISNYSGNDV